LTDAAVRNAKPTAKPYKLTDALGLYLIVKPNGAKLWRMKYRYAGRERLLAFGAYVSARSGGVDVTLAEARDRRDAARALLRDGIDPMQHRRDSRIDAERRAANTFAAVAEEWIAKNAGAWSTVHAERVRKFLRVELYPKLGGRPIDAIAAPELLAALEEIEARGALETAKKTRQYASAVFDYAQRTRGTIGNPAHALRGALTRRPAKRYAFLAEQDLGAFLVKLDAYGNRRTALALKLQLLTATRPGETRFARWCEFDLKRRLWHVPAERMKSRQPHTIPLSSEAMAVLRELANLGDTHPDALLFPSLVSSQQPISENTLNAALRRMGLAAVSHGVRHTFSTICNSRQLGRPDAIEAALAHRQAGVRGVYNAADYLDERRELMQRWADLLANLQSAERRRLDRTKPAAYPPSRNSRMERFG
jgi:integrase